MPLTGGGVEFLIPFDSTSFNSTLPYVTGFAVVNLDGLNTALFQCTIYDTTGTNLGASNLPVPPHGHLALALSSSPGFAVTAGRQGTLDCTTGGPQAAILGLRFLGANGMTSFAPAKLQ